MAREMMSVQLPATLRARRLLSWLALATVALLAAACTTLPTDSQPRAIGTIPQESLSTSVPEPTPGIDAFPLVREFLRASADPRGRHAAAREFLTPSADSQWNDNANIVIANRIDVLSEGLRTADTATFAIRADKVGQLSSDGVFTAEEGTVESQVTVVMSDGEWRIDELDNGVVIERPHFLTSYERFSVYFLDASGEHLVPDLRWAAVEEDQKVSQLMAMLIDGPSSRLAPGVRTRFSGDVRLRGPITKADGRASQVGVGLGGVRLDFQGLGSASLEERRRLAAQIVWTLDSAGIPGPYLIEADGAPLVEENASGWGPQDVASMDPVSSTATEVGLHAVVDGQVVAVTDTSMTPVPGTAGALDSVEYAAISHDGRSVALVARSDQSDEAPYQLLIGDYGGALSVVGEGMSITRPTWSTSDGAAWAVIDGETVTRVVRDSGTGTFSTTTVESGSLAALQGQITSLRLASDGTRVALIIGGRVHVAVVAEPRADEFTLVNPQPVALNLTDTAVALDWGTPDALLVVRGVADAPVARVSADGSRVEQLPRSNLSPPVTAVDASPTTEYVTDSRGVLRLGRDEPQGERFWREVTRLMGTDAKPILPG